MTQVDITFVVSDNAVTRRERRRQSAFREEVLGLAPGRRRDQILGNYLPAYDRRSIDGIECEWAPDRREHLDDGTAFDAVVAARRLDGRRLLIAVEAKYIDTFSRDRRDKTGEKDRKYRRLCEEFGMTQAAFDALGGDRTRQLLRNVLLTESVRRGGRSGESPLFDEALTVVLARDDDEAARTAVAAVEQERGALPTAVTFIGHGELADAAAGVDELAEWAGRFRRRYVGETRPSK